MTTAERIEAYRQAAIRHRTASMDGNYRATNRAHDALVRLSHHFRRGDPDMQRAFLALLDDGNLFVRSWAALHALELDPNRAVAVLQEIETGPPTLVSLDAEYILREWKEGSLRIP